MSDFSQFFHRQFLRNAALFEADAITIRASASKFSNLKVQVQGKAYSAPRVRWHIAPAFGDRRTGLTSCSPGRVEPATQDSRLRLPAVAEP